VCKAEAHELLERLFELALAEDEESAFLSFLTLNHSSSKSTPHALKRLRLHEWSSLRRNAHHYLSNPDAPASFEPTRWVPEEPGPDERDVKVFLRHHTRLPVPVTLRRDIAADAALRVLTLSM